MAFYQTEDQIVSPTYNPAFLTRQTNFVLSIFPLAGMKVSYNDQKVIKDMILNLAKGNQTNDDFKKVLHSLIKLDLFYQRMEIPILNVGYNTKIGSFNFSIKDNMQIMSDIKEEFSDFLLNTSERSIVLNSLQSFPASAMHYREFSLGYAKEIIENKLTIGLRAKLYFGKFSMNSDVKGEVVQKGENYYLQSHDMVKLSFPVKIITDADSILRSISTSDGFSVGNYLMNSGNTGAGFDLGFTYKINHDLVLSASVVDVGKINWRNNLNSIKFKGENQFPQEFVKAPNNNGILIKKEGFSAESTNIPELYKIELDNTEYSTNLPTNFYAGIKYIVNSNFNIGLVDRYIYVRKLAFNSISLAVVYKFNKKLTISTGYSVINNSYFNIPFALIYKWNSGQYFVGTDNLFSYIPNSSSGFAGITFGTCFYLFKSKNEKYSDDEYLPFYKVKRR